MYLPLPYPVVEQGDLVRTEFRPARPLQPCTYYFWTMRARFSVDGYPRVTEWAGAYNTGGLTVEPWWARRSYRPMLAGAAASEGAFYFPFRTPSAAGGRCR